MMQKLQIEKTRHSFRFACAATFLFLFSFFTIRAQTTISTTGSFTNDTTVNTVTFNFQNTNSYDVVIKSIEGILSAYGQSDITVWYKPTAISGNPGAISVPNGWTAGASGSVMGISNATNGVTQPFFNGMNIIIPANTTYGIAISASGTSGNTLRVGTGLPAFSIGAGGCNIISGATSGYAGTTAPPAAPTLSPKAWLGKITFAQVVPCTGTPSAATISGPANICSNALFILTSTPYAAGTTISYQWQKYNSVTLAWEDIPSETNSSYNCTDGISLTTQFRLKTSCTPSGTPSYSNILTVNTGGGLAGGVYTINNNAQSSATNFVSFSAAAAAMQCGITGPVTINVDPGSGPYTEHPTFNNIPGTSTTNTIRINGNGRVLQYNTSYSVFERGIINIIGTKYITLDSINLRSLGTSVGVGVLFNDAARYDSVTHCFIDMRSLINNTNMVSSGISFGYALTGSVNNSGISYIGYNYILGGNGPGGLYYGIFDGDALMAYSASNNIDTGNIIEHNTIENFNNIGISTLAVDGTVLAYNNIHRTNKVSPSVFTGIRCEYGYDIANPLLPHTIKIIGNRIHNPSADNGQFTFTGIEAGYVSAGTTDNNSNTFNNGNFILIANNAIYNINATKHTYGIKFSGLSYNSATLNFDTTRILHNTIDLNIVSNGQWLVTGIQKNGYFGDDFGRTFIKNNLVTITSTNASISSGFTFFTAPNLTSFNLNAKRNNYYVNATPAPSQFYGRVGTANYSTLSSFQLAYPSLETGSLSVDPQYTSTSTGDLTPLNSYLYNNGDNVLSDVPFDILGNPRPSTPTPGAFQIGAGIDAGVSALQSPLGTYCSNTKMVSVAIHNYGSLNINNVQVNWSLNGVLQTPFNYTGNIIPGGNASVNLGNGQFVSNTPVIIKAWTSIPNNQTDSIAANDTLTVTTQSAAGITVNIGPNDSICPGNTLTLNAGYPGATYLWDNNSTAQTRSVQNTGTYYVTVTAFDGCIGTDTMQLNLKLLPVINLGPDDSICTGNTLTLDAGNTGASYLWDNNSTTQTRIVQTAGTYYVTVTGSNGCAGSDTMNLSLNPLPVVDFGLDSSICTGNTLTLDAGNPGANYLWDDNSITQTRIVQTAGTYYVTVTLDGCTGTDTIQFSLSPLPVVDLGPDVDICEGSTYTFDADNPGLTYLWDNGVTTQTRMVDTAGTYEVHVTDMHGCTGADSVSVEMKPLPSVEGIDVIYADSGFCTFSPLNPQYVLNYSWNFGDGSAEVNGFTVQHYYLSNGTYNVILKMEGECTGLFVESAKTVNISNAGGAGTSISNIKLNDDISLYPNPARDMLQIDNKSDAKMNRIKVYNILGQQILEVKADNVLHHQLNTSVLSNGIYSIRIETDKGIATHKFEVMR